MKKKKNVPVRRLDALMFDEYEVTPILTEEAIDREMNKILDIKTTIRPIDDKKK